MANPADAEVKFDFETLAFESATEGDEVMAIYEFNNIGQQTLEIEIVSACDCMEVEWTRTPIPPGGRGKVEIVFDSTGRPGEVSKDIDLIFKNTDRDGYPLVKRVMLKGNILPGK